MEKVFEMIFERIGERIENEVKSGKKNQEKCNDENLNASGSQTFEIKVDRQGNANFEITKRGYGATVHLRAVVREPNEGVFDIEVTSSEGDSFSKKGVHAGNPVEGKIKTEGLLSWTTVRVKIHSSVPNTTLKGMVDYWT